MIEDILPFTSSEVEQIKGSEDSINLPHTVRQTIAARKKIQHKLPTWFSKLQVHYPASLSLEQCSSEKTAQYKASLFTGHRLVDLTSGFGIDSYYFSKRFDEVISVEQQHNLHKIAASNAHVLQVNNIKHIHDNALHFLSTDFTCDVIFLDPARRSQDGGKVFRLNDYEPRVLEILPEIRKRTNQLLIKVSPFADIKQLCRELPGVKAVYVVSVENECKEILLHCSFSDEVEPVIHAVNLAKSNTSFTFTYSQEKETKVMTSLPMKYVYEPNSSILKAGAFNLIAERFHITKLHKNTHWYTSDHLITDFPGRCFEIKEKGSVQHNTLKQYLPEMTAHLLLRNFPDTVAGLRKKLKLQEGGDAYVLVTTNCLEEKICLLSARVY